MQLRRESSPCNVWPADCVALGEQQAEELEDGGSTARFGPSVIAATDGSDAVSRTVPTPSTPARAPKSHLRQ
ncbi:MAG: hypothetical protein ACK5RA_06140 [Cyanobacteriota bacterium]